MAKHLMENLDLHSMLEDNYVKYGEMENKYKAVLRDNGELKATVDTLEQRIAKSGEDTRKQVAQLTEALFELSAKVHAGSGNKSPVLKGGSAATVDNNKPVVNAEMQRQMTLIKTGVKCNSSNITDMDLRFQLHENTTYDGHLLWKITDFDRRSQQAIIGKTRALHSAPCFTSKYGFKYCLRLYLNGDGMGKGTHLSLFLVIMKSEYDSVLQWPFQKNVKFTLINQQNRANDHVERMSPNKDSSSFQKPKKDMNVASGCPLFFNLENLEREGFLKDNALFIDVKME